MSASFDYTYLDMNTAQQTYADSEPPRRISWDESSLYYQTANEWEYPISNTYKSQNPSPKHEPQLTDNREISPLTIINGYEQDSETEDMESSASSIDENIIFNQKQGTRISLEDVNSDEDNESESSVISVPTDDEKDTNNNNNNETIIDEINTKIYSFNDKDMKLIIMESKVTDLTDKIGNLLEIIKQLKQRNQYLETSKLQLLHNTSNAINGCRDTIKKLNKQNQMLRKVNHSKKLKKQKKRKKKFV